MSLKQEENQLNAVFSFAALRRKGQTQLSTTRKQIQYELTESHEQLSNRCQWRLTSRKQLYYINQISQRCRRNCNQIAFSYLRWKQVLLITCLHSEVIILPVKWEISKEKKRKLRQIRVKGPLVSLINAELILHMINVCHCLYTYSDYIYMDMSSFNYLTLYFRFKPD